MRLGSGFGILDPMNKEKGPSVHHHLNVALGGAGAGAGAGDELSGTATPKEGDSAPEADAELEPEAEPSADQEEDITMEVDNTLESTSTPPPSGPMNTAAALL